MPTATTPTGLCASCAHMRTVTSARGSVFVMCERSRTDARYRKYPPLPVLKCDGYERSQTPPPAAEE